MSKYALFKDDKQISESYDFLAMLWKYIVHSGNGGIVYTKWLVELLPGYSIKIINKEEHPNDSK